MFMFIYSENTCRLLVNVEQSKLYVRVSSMYRYVMYNISLFPANISPPSPFYPSSYTAIIPPPYIYRYMIVYTYITYTVLLHLNSIHSLQKFANLIQFEHHLLHKHGILLSVFLSYLLYII